MIVRQTPATVVLLTLSVIVGALAIILGTVIAVLVVSVHLIIIWAVVIKTAIVAVVLGRRLCVKIRLKRECKIHYYMHIQINMHRVTKNVPKKFIINNHESIQSLEHI